LLFLLTDRKPNREPGAKQNDAASSHEYQIGICSGSFEEKFCAMALAAKQSTAVVVEINFESLIICAPK
jgi:hypothetical protein